MRKQKLNLPVGGRPNSEINVTPLVDVVLVLLIIFMVVTPLLEKDIEVKVPTDDVPEEVMPADDQLVVSLDDKGGVFLNSHPVAIEGLTDELRPLLDNRASDNKLVFFSPDEKANYGLLVQALDAAKEAGASALGVTTDPAAPVEPLPPGSPMFPTPAAPAAPPPPAPPPPPAKRHK